MARSKRLYVVSSLLALGLAAMAGCAALSPGALPMGTPIAQAKRDLIGLTGEHALPGGGTRLEFARGAYGRSTTLLDFDAGGRLVASSEALSEANFARIAPGMLQDEVRLQLGRPAEVMTVSWQRLHVWSYRFGGGDCVLFQVSISDDTHRVTEAGMGTDLACEGPNHRE